MNPRGIHLRDDDHYGIAPTSALDFGALNGGVEGDLGGQVRIEPAVSTRTDPITGGEAKPRHEISPLFGAAFFFLAGALRLHPATATAGLVIGVGAAVLNYGAGSAGSGEIEFTEQKPGWLQSHYP